MLLVLLLVPLLVLVLVVLLLVLVLLGARCARKAAAPAHEGPLICAAAVTPALITS